MPCRVLIVAGEASGDLHGANLARAMTALYPGIELYGMGGAAMDDAGVNLLYDGDEVAVVGVVEVLSHLSSIARAQKILRRFLDRQKPDLVVLIDLPDFNLLLAKKAKALAIPVFYYICPQIWAWRKKRVHTLKRRVDGLGVILPFEEEFYRKNGLIARYVGHPLLDAVESTCFKREFLQRYCGDDVKADAKLVALLPGSRKKEVASLLPSFLAGARELQGQSRARIVFLLSKARSIAMEDFIQAGIRDYQKELEIKIIEEDRYELMRHSDCALAASGTVTLELCLLNTPMVVAYRLSPLTYHLGKLLISLEHFSLVNLIAGRQIVPELLQDEVTDKRLAKELARLLYSYPARSKQRNELRDIQQKLGREGASARAADYALSFIKSPCHG